MCSFRYIVSITACLCMQAVASQAQQTGHFATFTTEDGLNNPRVQAIAQDEGGYLWLGSRDGVQRFDGMHFQDHRADMIDSVSVFLGGLTNVAALVTGPDGTLWIGHKGVSGYHPLRHEIVIKEAISDPCITPSHVHDLHVDPSGGLWAGTTNGLLQFADARCIGSFQPYPEHNEPRDHNEILVVESSSRTPERVVCLLRRSVTVFNTANQQFSHFAPPPGTGELASCALDSSDVLWIITQGGRLLSLDLASGAWSTHVFAPGLSGMNARTLFLVDGTLWIGMEDQGIFTYDLSTGDSRHFRHEPQHPHALPHGGVATFFQAKDGIIWIGSNSGLSKYDEILNRFNNHFLTDESGLPANFTVTSAHYDSTRKRYLVSSVASEGLMVFDADWKKRGTIQLPASLVSSGGQSIVDMAVGDAGSLWLVNERWIASLDLASNTVRRLQLRTGQPVFGPPLKVLVDDHTLWIGTQWNGLWQVDTGTGTVRRHFTAEGRWISGIAKGPDEHIYTASDALVARLDPATGSHEAMRFSPGDSTGLPHNDPRSIVFDKRGTMWIAFQGGGLASLDPAQGFPAPIKTYGMDDGLPSLTLFRLTMDNFGDVWISNTTGICRLNTTKMRFKNFNSDYGLRSNVQHEVDLLLLPSHEIFAGYDDGWTVFHPDSLVRNHNYPDVHISGMSVLNDRWLTEYEIKRTPATTLTYKQNWFNLEFNAVVYTIPSEITFVYALDGFDEFEQKCINCRSANYTNVPPGHYTFYVEASNHDGTWNPRRAELEIIITPAYWQTPLFIVLCSVVAMGMIWLVYRFRVGQMKRREAYKKHLSELEMRALRSQMNPHFMFNALNSIKRFIVKNEPHAASDYLNIFSNLMRQVLSNSRQQLITLEDDLKALDLYLRLEQMRFQDKFSYEITLGDGLDTNQIQIPPLLIQPYVENAIWHGILHKDGPGHVSISIDKELLEVPALRCLITDDGVGRQRAEELKSKSTLRKKSMGMQITRDRLDLLEQTAGIRTSVEIIDLYDAHGRAAGTQVSILVPLIED